MYSQEFLDLMEDAYKSGKTHAAEYKPPEHATSFDPVRCLYPKLDRTISKDEEYRALDQIRGILDMLPDDSYVKTAFTGCCDLAADNIRFDWLLSMPARIHYLENELYERDHRYGTI